MNAIGLIGFGRFGGVLYSQFKDRVDFRIYDPLKSAELAHTGIPFAPLPEVCRSGYVILAVPVSAIHNVAQRIAPLLPAGTVVMDVCAVKQYPMRVLEEHLAETVQIVGSHPLFGPDSVRNSLSGHLMLITPRRVSESDYRNVRQLWENRGVRLIEMDADEQDRLMAWTLALTHFLGRGLVRLPLPQTAIATKDYLGLIRLTEKINRDTPELFQDMHRYNPYTREMRERLLKAFSDLKDELDQLNAPESAD